MKLSPVLGKAVAMAPHETLHGADLQVITDFRVIYYPKTA